MKQKLPFFGIILGLAAMLLRSLLGNYPELIEAYYSRSLYIGIRMVIDMAQCILPFSCLYLLIFLLVVKLVKGIRWWINDEAKWTVKLGQTLLSIFNIAGWVIFLFLFLWGFNYGRVPFTQQAGLDPQPLSLAQIESNLATIAPQLLTARQAIPGHRDTVSFTHLDFPKNRKAHLQQLLEAQLSELGYPDAGHPRLRMGYPKGMLRGFGAIGFYNPLTGECNVDPGVHPIDEPFVVAHELAHAYGFGNEGVCNFLAYLTCMRSDDAFVRYSGIFNYWQYLYAALSRGDREKFNIYYANLPIPLKTDIESIDQNSDLYPYFLPRTVQRATYDAYLKSQGVKEGFASYSEVLMLVEAWRKAE